MVSLRCRQLPALMKCLPSASHSHSGHEFQSMAASPAYCSRLRSLVERSQTHTHTLLESGGGGGSRGEVARGGWAGGGLAWLASPPGSTSHPPCESILCVALRPSQIFGLRVWVNIYSSCLYSVRPACQMRLACSSTELSWLSTQSGCCSLAAYRLSVAPAATGCRSNCEITTSVTIDDGFI